MQARAHYLAAVNRARNYIDANLAGDTSLPTLAGIAGFSSFHFHRVFFEATGETLHALVMRVRLERAIVLLRAAPGKSLTSIAAEVGFGSSSSLSRAFAQRFGVKASSLRSNSAMHAFLAQLRPAQPTALPSQTPALEQSHAALGPSLRIENWPAVPLAYVRVTGAYLDPAALVAAYRKIEDWADAQGLDSAASRLIGMSMDDPAVVPLAKCRYDFCRESNIKPLVRSGISHDTLPANTWAVLPCKGDLAAVERCWNYLFREWLPASGWQPAALPALEVFHGRPEQLGWEQFDLDCCLPLAPFYP